MTYAELEQRINRVANGLISLGVERFERVLVIFERHPLPQSVGIRRGPCLVAVPVNFSSCRRSTSTWLETVGVASSSAAPGWPNPVPPAWPTGLPRSVSSSMRHRVRFEAMRTGWPPLRPNPAIMGRPAAATSQPRRCTSGSSVRLRVLRTGATVTLQFFCGFSRNRPEWTVCSLMPPFMNATGADLPRLIQGGSVVILEGVRRGACD